MEQADRQLAELVIKRGFATRQQVDECLRVVSAAVNLGSQATLADTLVDKGYVSRDEVEQLLEEARQGAAKITSLAGYELVAKLGGGAMGVVYKARQVAMDRIVAIKILRPAHSEDEVFVKRFFREVRAAAKLNHPNIVQAIDAGLADGYHYFVMEYVDGPTVAQRLKKSGTLGEEEALRIARDVAAALQHAQHLAIVHRDIKPENIMLTADGTAKLADLGIAKDYDAEATATLTLEGRTVGTPYYMSPEQARGERNLDVRSDIYSLGATLFRMVTGSVPFEGETAAVIISRRLSEPVPSPQDRRPDLSRASNKLIMRMMAKDPQQRFETAQALVDAIDAVLSSVRTGGMTSMVERLAAAARRRRSAAPPRAPAAASSDNTPLYIAAAAGAGAVLVALLLWLVIRTPSETPPAEREAQQAFEQAAAYAKAHPDDLDGAIQRFTKVQSQHRATVWAGHAATRTAELRREKNERTARSLWQQIDSIASGGLGPGNAQRVLSLIADFDHGCANTEHYTTVRDRLDALRKQAARLAELPSAVPHIEAGGRLFDGKTLRGWRIVEEYAGHGEIRVDRGQIVLEQGKPWTGIAWAGEFPTSGYELAIEAMRQAGTSEFCAVTFPVGAARCVLIAGVSQAPGVLLAGVESPGGARQQSVAFENDRWYDLRLRVSEAKIEAWVDQHQVIDVARSASKFPARAAYEPIRTFGISSLRAKLAVRSIELKRLKR